MATPVKRMASKARKTPILQVGEQIIEGTRFLLASLVLVYVVVLVSPQDVMNARESWTKPLHAADLTEAFVLELQPVLEENDTVQKAKAEVSSSHQITLSPNLSELA